MARTMDFETETRNATKEVEKRVESHPLPAPSHNGKPHEDAPKPEAKAPAPRSKTRQWLVLAAAFLVVAGTAAWWLDARNYESTDDAQVDGHIALVSPRVSGTVVYINPKVENNQYVEAGTLLLELDPRDYQAELEHAQADLATRTADAQ